MQSYLRPGALTYSQTQQALARAQARLKADRGPEDRALAEIMVKRYSTRLAVMDAGLTTLFG